MKLSNLVWVIGVMTLTLAAINGSKEYVEGKITNKVTKNSSLNSWLYIHEFGSDEQFKFKFQIREALLNYLIHHG